jgi:hypothetical protein
MRHALPGVPRTFDELDGFHRDGCYWQDNAVK